MTTDKKNPDWLFNDRDGAGKTISRKLVDHIGGDTEGFRTVIVKDGDRGDTMLRTKGGKKEVTMQEVKLEQLCIKGPLIEIAFKYNNITALTGYRRWYGEPDPNPPVGAPPEPEFEPQYIYSSDGLLCMETRKLQKICCTDGNGNKVDFLFAKRPDSDEDEGLPASSSAARSTARFKLIEGPYSKREWYKTELADIGWAFSGPTIKGDPTPEPASAVKFFVRRLRSIIFTVTDTLKKVKSSGVKWVFLNATEPTRTLGAVTETCANQNAREVSFSGRTFFTPNTDGNMERITMSVGIDQPPAITGGPSFTVRFKKPGSFIAAIDPEGATGNARPAEIEKAIDLMDSSSFGNPYHGFIYWEQGEPPIFYKSSAKTDQWGFTPTTPLEPPMQSLFAGWFVQHRYYNFSGVDSLQEDNIVRPNNGSGEMLLKDAFSLLGNGYVKDRDYAGWGQLQYYEQLYRDENGVVWVVSVSFIAGNVQIRLLRRYGVLGTNFGIGAENTIDRVLLQFSMASENRADIVEQAPDGKQLLIKKRSLWDVFGECSEIITDACVVTLSGSGAIKDGLGVSEGDGISATFTLLDVRNGVLEDEYQPTFSYSIGSTQEEMEYDTFTCGTESAYTWSSRTWTPTVTETLTGFTTQKKKVSRYVMDIQWVEGRWQEIYYSQLDEYTVARYSQGAVSPLRQIRVQDSCEFNGYWVSSYSFPYTSNPSYEVHGTGYGSKRTTKLMRGGDVVWEYVFERVRSPWTSVSTLPNPDVPVWNHSSSGGEETVIDPNGYGHEAIIPTPVLVTSCTRPEYLVYGTYYAFVVPTYGQTAIGLKFANNTLSGNGESQQLPIVYRDAIINVDPYLLQPWTDPDTTRRVSARVGWAYDYRVREFFTVPPKTIAYFI